MRRVFLFSCGIVALLVLATTAALAGGGKGRSDAVHGKSAQASHAKSGGAQATAHSTTHATVTASSHGQAGTHGKGGTHAKAGVAARGGAEAPPGCNGTIHISAEATAGNGTQPKYTMGEEVWAHGRGFDGIQAFTHFTVYKVNSGHAVIKDDSSGWTADADGAFDLDVIDTSLTPGHEYQVVVYWNRTLPNGNEKECRKSKNFFTLEEEQGGEDVDVGLDDESLHRQLDAGQHPALPQDEAADAFIQPFEAGLSPAAAHYDSSIATRCS